MHLQFLWQWLQAKFLGPKACFGGYNLQSCPSQVWRPTYIPICSECKMQNSQTIISSAQTKIRNLELWFLFLYLSCPLSSWFLPIWLDLPVICVCLKIDFLLHCRSYLHIKFINPFTTIYCKHFLHSVAWFLIVNGFLMYMFRILYTFSFIFSSSALMFRKTLHIFSTSAFVALFIFKNI